MKFIEIGERIGIVTVLEIWLDGTHRKAKCKCDCGRTYSIKTGYVRRRRGLLEVSCGCLRRAINRANLAAARAKRTPKEMRESGLRLAKRLQDDPTPWEIAERCAEIHEEAGRQLPEQLTAMLNELRKTVVYQ